MLAQELSTHDPFSSKSPPGRPSIPTDKCLAAFLWVLATNERRVHVAERFDMSISSLHNIIDQIIDITVNHLQAKFIRWPDAGERAVIDGSTDRRCFAIVTNERAILSGSDQPVRKVRQTPYCVFQAGKQTFKDRHICSMVWCIVNIGNGYELNNNKGKTD